MRTAEIKRKTNETDIQLIIKLDGSGNSNVNTGCAFLDHMLTLLAKHGKFDLYVACRGDIEVDFHHTTEDIAICLGLAFKKALGNKAGIIRYADTTLPMDEALILTAIDLSGRGYFACDLDIKADKVGSFDTELVYEFWQAFSMNAGATVHIKQLAGANAHHIIEGVFKSMARSLRCAVKVDPDFASDIPSTKGLL